MVFKILVKSDNTQSRTYCYSTNEYTLDDFFIIFTDLKENKDRKVPKHRLIEVIKE
jgi:hypothetical protein